MCSLPYTSACNTSTRLTCPGVTRTSALTQHSRVHTILAHSTRRNGPTPPPIEAGRYVVAADVQHSAYCVNISQFRLCRNCYRAVPVCTHKQKVATAHSARCAMQVMHLVPRISVLTQNVTLDNSEPQGGPHEVRQEPMAAHILSTCGKLFDTIQVQMLRPA